MNDVTIVRDGVKRIHTFRSKVLSINYVNDRLRVLTDRGLYLADKGCKRFRKVKQLSP